MKKATHWWYALLVVVGVAWPVLVLSDGEAQRVGPAYEGSSPESAATVPPEEETTAFRTFVTCPGVLGTSTSSTQDVTVTITSRNIMPDMAVTELSVGSPGFPAGRCEARVLLSGPEIPGDLVMDGVSVDEDPRTPRSVTVPLGETVELVSKRTDPGGWTVAAD